MEWKLILISVVGLLGLFLVGPVMVRPLKLLLRLVIYLLAGGVLLYVANILLNQVGLRVAINPVTLFTAGVLQIPGVVLLAVLSYLFA
jgi:inhibitor of the pro-sigma K processing machinery